MRVFFVSNVRRLGGPAGAAIALVGGLLGATLTAVSGGPLAQLTLPSPATSAPTSVRQNGIYFTAPIVLDGATLFTIAGSSTASVAQLTVQQRLADIQTTLGEVIERTGTGSQQPTEYDPRTLRIPHRARSRSSFARSCRRQASGPLADRDRYHERCAL